MFTFCISFTFHCWVLLPSSGFAAREQRLRWSFPRGRTRCEHKNLFLFYDFSSISRHFKGSSVCGSSAGLGSDRGCLGHWLGSGAGGSGGSELWSIVSAEEDPAVSQEQLEMTAKAEIGKCDKLMD